MRFVLIGLGSVAASIALAVSAWIVTDPLPPVLRGLQNGAGGLDGSRHLTERLQASFPIGSQESKLIHDLRNAGFELDSARGAMKHKASFALPGDVIHRINRVDAFVYWSADDSGRLTAILGYFSQTWS
jgi:hypothetical protein